MIGSLKRIDLRIHKALGMVEKLKMYATDLKKL